LCLGSVGDYVVEGAGEREGVIVEFGLEGGVDGLCEFGLSGVVFWRRFEKCGRGVLCVGGRGISGGVAKVSGVPINAVFFFDMFGFLQVDEEPLCEGVGDVAAGEGELASEDRSGGIADDEGRSVQSDVDDGGQVFAGCWGLLVVVFGCLFFVVERVLTWGVWQGVLEQSAEIAGESVNVEAVEVCFLYQLNSLLDELGVGDDGHDA